MKTPNMDRFTEGRPEPDLDRLEEIRQDRADAWQDDRIERELRQAMEQADVINKMFDWILEK